MAQGGRSHQRADRAQPPAGFRRRPRRHRGCRVQDHVLAGAHQRGAHGLHARRRRAHPRRAAGQRAVGDRPAERASGAYPRQADAGGLHHPGSDRPQSDRVLLDLRRQRRGHSGRGEWSLDSQDVVGMAGGQVGKLIFYNIPTLSNANLTADFNTIVNANATKIINVSLGECETSAQGDGSAAAQDQIFQQAVAQGQTFSISTGDSGADECGDGGVKPSWPAASQYVVAVGGTTLNATTTTWNSATVWTSGGGSSSTFEPQPSWQNGVAPGSTRGLPDIAYDADPNSGSKIIVNGATQQYGGTSLSAPLFAGAWARIIALKGS